MHLCLNILHVSFLPVSRVSLIYALSTACSICPKAATPSQKLVWWLLKKMTKFPVLFLSALVACVCVITCSPILVRGKALAECHIHPLPVSLTGCLAEYNELPVTSPSFHFSLQRQVEKPDGPFAYLLILFFKFVSRHSGLYPSDILRLSTRGYIYLNRKGFQDLSVAGHHFWIVVACGHKLHMLVLFSLSNLALKI